MKFILPVLDVAPIAPPHVIQGEIVEEAAKMPTSLIVTLVVCGLILVGLTVFFIVKNNKNGGDAE